MEKPKTYDFVYSVHEVDGKQFGLIECRTWPYLNIQVLSTTPERFDSDVEVVKARAMCGYTLQDKTFILMHAGGEGRVKVTQKNHTEVYEGMKAIMNAAVKWWLVNKYRYENPDTIFWSDAVSLNKRTK